LRSLVVDDRIVSVIKAMYEDATAMVKIMNSRVNNGLSEKVEVHQGSVFSSAHCYSLLYWRLYPGSLEKACMWNFYVEMI